MTVTTITMPEDTNPKNIIEVTMEDLNDEQRKMVEDNKDAFVRLCLDSFGKTRGRVIHKSSLPTPFVMVTSTRTDRQDCQAHQP
jgi:hypothetical protein